MCRFYVAARSCQARCFTVEPTISKVKRWRAEWDTSAPEFRNNGLLEHLNRCVVHCKKRSIYKLTFLGMSLCQKAFRRCTGVNPYRFAKLAKKGVLSWEPKPRPRPRTMYDAMYAAVMMKVDLMRNSSPFARRLRLTDDLGDTGVPPTSLPTISFYCHSTRRSTFTG